VNLKRLWTAIFPTAPHPKQPVGGARRPPNAQGSGNRIPTSAQADKPPLAQLLGFRPGKPEIYQIAFRHSSSTDPAAKALNNQRLEYLGDAILGAAVADYLYQRLPGRNEGYLTQMRSKIVSRRSLNEIGSKMQLHRYIESRLRRPEKGESVLGDALEALIGAVYIDKGFEGARKFVVERIIERFINFEELDQQVISYKGKLIEWAQKHKKQFQIKIAQEEGIRPDRPKFRCEIWVDDQLISASTAGSKKKAEEKTAAMAYSKLGLG